MAASDLAFLESRDRSADRRIAEEERGRLETRRVKAGERADTLFDRSTTLFEDQQAFIADERRLQKLSRDGNTAIALFRATKGQVFQPILDVYGDIPDGGKFHQFRRNEDGTFDYDIEWAGQRFTKKNAKYDEVGKMAMSIANPVMYLEESGAIASAEAAHLNKLEIERTKNLRRKQETTRILGDKLSTKEWLDMRKGFLEEYTGFRDSQPELLEVPDASEESGVRQISFEEYQTMKFAQIGIDVTGARIGDKGVIDFSAPPPNPLTSSFTEMQRFLQQDEDKGGEAIDAAIQVFIDHDRTDELVELFLQDPGKANTLTPAQESKILRAQSGKAAGSDPEAAKKDAEQAAITVEQVSDTQELELDPLQAFAERHKNPPKTDIVADLKAVGRWLAEFDRKTQDKRLKTTWAAFLSGNERNKQALKLLSAGQTQEGRAKLGKEYRKIRVRLPTELRDKLDKVFPQPISAGAIPDRKEKEV